MTDTEIGKELDRIITYGTLSPPYGASLTGKHRKIKQIIKFIRNNFNEKETPDVRQYESK